MMEKSSYKPINCDYYDVLTVYVMHKDKVIVRYKDGSENEEVNKVEGFILDIYTKDKAEYLKMNDGLVIRLDNLLHVEVVQS